MLHRHQGVCPAKPQRLVASLPGTCAGSSRRSRAVKPHSRRVVSTSATSDPDVSTTTTTASSNSSSTPSVSVSDVHVSSTQPVNTSGAASTSSSKPDNNALQARIAAAKAYKYAGSSSISGSSSSPGLDSSSSSSSPESTSSASSNAEGPLTEQQQEAMRQQYMQQLQQQQQELASQSSAYNSFLQSTAAAGSSGGSSGGSNALERLQQEDQGWGPGSKTGPARGDFYTSADAPAVDSLLQSAPRRSGLGSADVAADWLKGVLADAPGAQPQAPDPNLRPEDFTAAKEAAAKQRGAEIITAFPEDFASSSGPDAAAAAAAAAAEGAAAAADSSSTAGAAAAAAADTGEDGKYKPKVTTWGVFPRPSNISAAYGGGRNIRPGQDLETPQQKAQREADYAAALAKYKAAVFTDSLSDEELAAAQARFNEGMQLFNRGIIDQALPVFDEVRNKVPLKSKLGGLSTLQAAVCYDTLGNARQAEALYKRIQGHPTTEVGRKARQLVFGFQAMTFLKTEGLNYAVKKEDYLKYFRRSADRRRVYVASEEERALDAVEARKAAAIAAGIVLGPVVMMGAMLLGK